MNIIIISYYWMSKEMEEQRMTEIVHFAKSKMYAGKTFLSSGRTLSDLFETFTKKASKERTFVLSDYY